MPAAHRTGAQGTRTAQADRGHPGGGGILHAALGQLGGVSFHGWRHGACGQAID
ncbi:hypothetical protein SK237_10760 [Novacetimonas hansenii]|uniref:hypothetical protein n=1 Tax=Novacetimonas hansenii TaxID=436 RepID=UPI002231BB7F|nr:hypothetical protein [Novacetimonas hansenii]